MSRNMPSAGKSSICRGCLSSDRILQSLGKYSNLYSQLLGESQFYDYSETKLCWECTALLRRTHKFQSNIVSAQYMLQQWNLIHDINKSFSTLSSLSKVVKNAEDFALVHEDKFKKTILISPPPEQIVKKEDLPITIKKEYDDYDDDNDFDIDFDVDVKLEDIKPKKEKKKSKTKSPKLMNSFNYKKYAKIIPFDLEVDNLEKYYDRKIIDSEEMEEAYRLRKKKRKNKLWCAECNYGFGRPLHFHRHQDLLHTNPTGPYTCSGCGTECTTKQHLSEHWKVHNDTYRCLLCSKHWFIREWDVRNHLIVSHRKEFVCKTCGKVLSSCTDFRRHYRELHKYLICDTCGFKTMVKRLLERHMIIKHLPHICAICAFEYSNYKTYTNHMKMYHPRLVQARVDLEAAYCVECNRQFPSIAMYKRHLNDSVVHKPRVRKQIPCPECGKQFAKNTYMKNHFNHYHLKKTKNYCSICDKYYCNAYGLRKHKRKVHDKVPDPKNKICDMCGRGFATNRVLINHRRTHTGERPHACAHCAAAFAQQTALVSHVRTQHKHNTL